MNWNMTLLAILLQNCMGCVSVLRIWNISPICFSLLPSLRNLKSSLGPVGIGLSTSILSIKLFGNQFSVIKCLATR